MAEKLKTFREWKTAILDNIEKSFGSGSETIQYSTCLSMGEARGWEPNLYYALEVLMMTKIQGVRIRACSSHGCLDWTIVKLESWTPKDTSTPPQWAIDAAQIITQMQYGDPKKITTQFGLKTTCGVAGIIYSKWKDAQ